MIFVKCFCLTCEHSREFSPTNRWRVEQFSPTFVDEMHGFSSTYERCDRCEFVRRSHPEKAALGPLTRPADTGAGRTDRLAGP